MRNILAVIALTGAVLFTGCVHQTASTTPPTAASIYSSAATQMDNFATDLGQIQGIEQNLHTGGVIPDATHTAIETQFNAIAQYGVQIDALIAANASQVTIVAKINAALTSLASIAASTGSIDANTQAQIAASIQALQLLLNGVITTLQAQQAATS